MLAEASAVSIVLAVRVTCKWCYRWHMRVYCKTSDTVPGKAWGLIDPPHFCGIRSCKLLWIRISLFKLTFAFPTPFISEVWSSNSVWPRHSTTEVVNSMCIIPALLAHVCCIWPVQRGHRALSFPSGEAEIAGWISVPLQELGNTCRCLEFSPRAKLHS